MHGPKVDEPPDEPASPPQSRREAVAKVNCMNLQGNGRQKSIPATSHAVHGSNCRTQLTGEESRVDTVTALLPAKVYRAVSRRLIWRFDRTQRIHQMVLESQLLHKTVD